jgi:hypothetical protein
MRQSTEGFKIEDDLARCLEKLEEAMTTLIKVYDHIQEYQDQQNLANFIAAVSSPESGSDDDNNLNKLEILIRSNLLLKQYHLAVRASKQWVFPFANHYLERIKLPFQLELKSDTLQDLASKAIEQLDHVKSKVDEYKTAIQRHDAYIFDGAFDSSHDSTHPFYVWKNEENKELMSQLLSGKPIFVKADVTKSVPDKDAIKFNLLEINLKVANATRQEEVNGKLKSFKVKATHMGNSYYRYDGQIYILSSPSQEIQCSFERDPSGLPIHRNQVYNKIKAGDLMLSPFAMWNIQLVQLNNNNETLFNELAKFKDEVDLELVGRGRYIDKGAKIPNLNIANYYRSESDALEGPYRDPYDVQQEQDGFFIKINEIDDDKISSEPLKKNDQEPLSSSGNKVTSWIGNIMIMFGKKWLGRATLVEMGVILGLNRWL